MIYPSAKISSRTKMFVPQDDKFLVGDFCLITVPELVIGTGSQINSGSKLVGQGKVVIGDYSVISYDCLLITSSDSPTESFSSDFLPDVDRDVKTAPIMIGENVFIGAGTVIMPGVTIYDGAVIGAHSYIDKDVKDWQIKIPGKKPRKRAARLRSFDHR